MLTESEAKVDERGCEPVDMMTVVVADENRIWTDFRVQTRRRRIVQSEVNGITMVNVDGRR